MARPEARRLVVNADDFGRSPSINQAVIRSHLEGILTTASLMVNEPACSEAVQLARDNPQLGVGLHLALLCGKSALSPERLPGLVDASGQFSSNPVAVGLRYFAKRGLRSQLRDEIDAQFDRFHATGLPLDHLNGHLHLHLHPVVFDLLMENAKAWRITHIRLTREPLSIDRRISTGNWFYRFSHALIYKALSARSAGPIDALRLRHTDRVFGLLQNAQVSEDYILKLLPLLPSGDSELYSHPSLDEFAHEFAALISPRVKQAVSELGIRLIRYADL